MELNILLKIAIIFLFFTAVDICGHFIFKTKRNVPEWLLTIGVVLAFAGTTFLAYAVISMIQIQMSRVSIWHIAI